MVAIPEAAGARYAPCWAMRAVLRTLVLGALLTAGWLLGSGTSHADADEDPGLPSSGLIHLVNTASSAEGSSVEDSPGRAGAQPAAIGSPLTRSAVTEALTAVPVRRLPVHPPVQVGALRPIVDSVSLPEPLANGLVPVARPLPGTTPRGAATSAPAPAAPLTKVLPATLAGVAAVPRAIVHTAVFTPAPAGPAAPAEPLCSPAHPAVAPVIVQPAARDGMPADPGPTSPPGNSTSACLLDSASGGSSTKGGSDVAVQAGSAITHFAQAAGLSARDTSGLPRSSSAEPSTSPD